ncbi:MAG: hypothetical protein ACTINP_07330 [Leuconostoc mesenteroides]
MKFTEEQYQKIVEMFEKVNDEYNMGFLNPNIVTFFQDKLYKEFGDMMYFVEDWQSITALANPLTREWAHDKFVEEEKRYVWISQKSDDKGEKIRLHKTPTNAIKGSLSTGKERVLHDEELTESEVKEWGFDTDKFDKKEVVVTEKKYVWTSKKSDTEGQHIRLWLSDWHAVSTSFVEQGETFSENEKLTESEIKEWGYNPEMFDREEVQ